MKDKAALITGGAKRIGRAIALYLAKKGFDIALHYNTSKKEAHKLAKEIKKTGQKCKLFQCDLSKINHVLKLMKKVKNQFPNLSLLINNASLFKENSLLNTDIKFFEKIFNVNFKAPFFLSREFARNFKVGQIINMLDTNIKRKKSRYFAYTLSKKGLFEFTQLAASDLAPSIRVNAIAPGAILAPRGKDKEYLKRKATTIPLKQTGVTNNILQAVDFLLENDFITGECLFIDGGENL